MIDSFLVLTPDQGTKLKILHAIDKPLREMSVSMICDNAQVSRKTFYRHFNTKLDPAYWYSGLIERTCLNEIGRSLSWDEGVSLALALRRKEANAIICSSDNNIDDGDNPRRFMRRKETILATLNQHGHTQITDHIDFVVSTYIGIEMAAFNYFLDHYTDIEIEELAQLFLSVVPPEMFELMPPRGKILDPAERVTPDTNMASKRCRQANIQSSVQRKNI